MLGYFVAAAVVVWIAQTILGLRQFKKFNNHIKELRKKGRVAIGRARGHFTAGVLVLFVIDSDCRILRGEIMEGRTVFAGFRAFEHFNVRTCVQCISAHRRYIQVAFCITSCVCKVCI